MIIRSLILILLKRNFLIYNKIKTSSSPRIMKNPFTNSFSFLHLLLVLIPNCFLFKLAISSDTITSTKFIKDPETIISNREFFELGFFNPLNSTNRYVGIWDKRVSVQTIIWVANRDKPLKNKSGFFTISKDGNLVIFDEQNITIWNSNVSNPTINSIARLLDSGNLVLQDPVSGVIIWESFKTPSDKFLPMMKFITNSRTGEKVELVSWRSDSDPSLGRFSFGIDPFSIPEVFIWKEKNLPFWRSGPWDGQVFIGIHNMSSGYLSGINLVLENRTYTLSVANANEAQLFFYYLNPNGSLEEMHWSIEEQKWKVEWSAPETECGFYGTCGGFGICNSQTIPICSCLRGFEPKNREEWNKGNWTNGCVRKSLLQCEMKNNTGENGREDVFLKLEMIKVPDFAQWIVASEDQCRVQCLANCSCTAYAYRTGIGCMIWTVNLIDIEEISKGGADIYVRVAYSDKTDEKTNDMKVTIMASVISGTFVLLCCIYCFWRRKNQNKCLFGERGRFFNMFNDDDDMLRDKMSQVKLQELTLFDFEKLATATNYFHLSNKLGQGGYGPVYKGKMMDGQEIAVKRLSKASGQGLEEFVNEVTVISKLQHRNLVQLLGCCVDGDEKMLVYEYMPNKSLDAFIFESTEQEIIDWRKRFDIIEGIARGLLYLHRDSRLKIIHRDLKASNILLDKDLNPKISDFGTARIFYGNEIQANTTRVVGTYGYMSPEYAMEGKFSEKSDIFSFGVLLLEIVSGRKNTGFYHNEHALSLLGFTWKLWIEDCIADLVDLAIFETRYEREVLRCIHVGLLCVQEFANDRPNIPTILSMLNNEITNLPTPKQPGFSSRQIEIHSDTFKQGHVGTFSANMITVTTVEGR